MRDERFYQNQPGSQYWDALIVHGRQATGAPWFADVVETVYTWYLASARTTNGTDLLAPDDDVRARLAAIVSLPHVMVPHLLAWWHEYPPREDDDPADTQRRTREEVQAWEARQAQAAWVWGIALARAAPQFAAHADAFERTWQMAASEHVAAEAFIEVLAAACRADRESPLRTRLSAIPGRVRSLRSCHVLHGSREDLAAALDLWWATAHVHDIWDRRAIERFPVSCAEVWLLDALRRDHKDLYLHLLEETRNPHVVGHMLGAPCIMEDVDEILALLAAAPPVLTSLTSATSWNHNVTALVLLEVVATHATTLIRLVSNHTRDDPPSDLAEIVDKDVPRLIKRVVEGLLQRDDGTFLAVNWMIHRTHALEGTARRNKVSPEAVVVEAMAGALAAHDIGEPEFRRIWPDAFSDVRVMVDDMGTIQARGPRSVYETDAVLALLAVARHGSDHVAATATMTGLLPVFEALLAQRDPGIGSIRETEAPSQRQLYAAILVVAAVDPDQTWCQLWNDVAEQRRRQLYQSYTHDYLADETSLFVLHVGIAALVWTYVDDGTHNDDVRRLWDHLFDAALSVVIRQRSWQKGDRWRAAVSLVVAHLPHVLDRIGGNRADAHQLSSALRRLGGDDELVMEAVAALYHSGIAITDMMAALTLSEIHLDQIVARCDAMIERQAKTRVYGMPPTALDECRTIIRDVRHDDS